MMTMCIYCKLLTHQFHETIDYRDSDPKIKAQKGFEGIGRSEETDALSKTLLTGIGCNTSIRKVERSNVRGKHTDAKKKGLFKKVSTCGIM